MKFSKIFHIIFVVAFQIVQQQIAAEKILFVAVNFESSHRRIYLPIINGLLQRGHHVTAIVSKEFKIHNENYQEILIEPQNGSISLLNQRNWNHQNRSNCVYQKNSFSCLGKQLSDLREFWEIGRNHSIQILEDENMADFIRESQGEYDLVISELYAQEVLYMLSFSQKAPLVLISSKDYSQPHIDALGGFSIWSQIPFLFEAHDSSDNLWDRFINRFRSLVLVTVREHFHLSALNKIADTYFSSTQMYNKELPTIQALEKSVSLMIFNSLQMLSLTKPRAEGILDIAGIHIRNKKELPKDIKKFLDSAVRGVMYFDLDSILKYSTVDTNINTFLEMFKNVNYKVLVKFKDENIKTFGNVLIRKRIPRNDVLAHYRVKLFVSNGDIMGIQEAAFHGVPMIIIPVYGDQFENARKVEEAVVGFHISLEDFTPMLFLKYFRQITRNQTFLLNIKKVSEIFKSDFRPIENTLYWLEHIMQFKEDYLFQSLPRDVPYYEYLFLDFICMGIVFILSAVWLLRKILCLLMAILRFLKKIWNWLTRIFRKRKAEEKDYESEVMSEVDEKLEPIDEDDENDEDNSEASVDATEK